MTINCHFFTKMYNHIAHDCLSALIPPQSKSYRNTISEMHKIFEILAPEQLNTCTMNHFYHRRVDNGVIY